MNKKYTLVLLSLALTASAGAAERQIAKCLKVNAPRPISRPATDYTGATADSIVSYNGGMLEGELMTGGYPFLKTEFDRTETSVVVTDFEWDLNQWKACDRVESVNLGGGTVLTTDYFIEEDGEATPMLRQYVTQTEGLEEIIAERYDEGQWVKVATYTNAEANGLEAEEAEYFDAEGNMTGYVSSLVYYDERGEVERQDYAYTDLTDTAMSFSRTLIGTYNEDGTIHTLQDEYSKFETEFLGVEAQVIRAYERYDTTLPFELQTMVTINDEDHISVQCYSNGVVVSFLSESFVYAEGYEGGVWEEIYFEYDDETGEVIDGAFDLTYYPDEDNEELIEKVINKAWVEDYLERGLDEPWATELVTEYKYTEDYLCQLQESGPIALGSKDLVLYGYDQYFYPENGLGIRKINGRELLKGRNLDLLGRRMNEKQAGLGIRNGKLTYSAE